MGPVGVWTGSVSEPGWQRGAGLSFQTVPALKDAAGSRLIRLHPSAASSINSGELVPLGSERVPATSAAEPPPPSISLVFAPSVQRTRSQLWKLFKKASPRKRSLPVRVTAEPLERFSPRNNRSAGGTLPTSPTSERTRVRPEAGDVRPDAAVPVCHRRPLRQEETAVETSPPRRHRQMVPSSSWNPS